MTLKQGSCGYLALCLVDVVIAIQSRRITVLQQCLAAPHVTMLVTQGRTISIPRVTHTHTQTLDVSNRDRLDVKCDKHTCTHVQADADFSIIS